jgi:imidazole glycerol-phosphate synthase subunit HisH
MIVIIDYGAGNLRSVVNAVKKLGYQPQVTNRPADVLKGQAVVLPGVGAAGETMVNLKRSGMDAAVRQCIATDRPFLGVCLGLQVLFDRTEEDNGYNCLGILSGQVKRLPEGQKIPHMGWNQVKQTITHPIFAGIPDMTHFYFVHSYYAVPSDLALTAGQTEYGVNFCSVIARGNLVATQFHPEKSGDPGLKIYSNFFKMAGVSS